MGSPVLAARIAFRAAALFLLCAVAAHAGAEPVVSQGGTTVIAPTGSSGPGKGDSWDILLSGSTVASSQKAAGWSASYNATTKDLSVTAPATAAVATGYEVRVAYKSGAAYYSAAFEVLPGLKSIKILPNSVVGGGTATGTITLTSAPTVNTIVNLKCSITHASVPATVSVPKSATSVTFTVKSQATSKNGTATITGTLEGSSAATTFTVYAKSDFSFKTPLVYTIPGGVNDGLFTADIDGDGNQDVIVGTGSGWGVLYGKGDGTLKPFKLIYTWQSGMEVRGVADLNGDGKPDVVAVTNSGEVMIFLNKGKGSFGAPQTFSVPNATFCAIGTFANGAEPDVLVMSSRPSSYSGGAQMLLNNGKGTFKLGASWGVGMFVQGVAAAKFEGDKNLDVVISGATGNLNSTGVSVMYGEGNGSFKSGPSFGVDTSSVGQVAVADVNRDGIPDIVLATWGDGSAAVMFGGHGGAFEQPEAFVAGSYASGVGVADMDGDGWPDIVVSLAGSQDISVLLGQGGLFPTYDQINTGGSDCRNMAIADFNNDGKPDVVVQGGSTGTISVLINNRP